MAHTTTVRVDIVVGGRASLVGAAPVLACLRERRPEWSIRLPHTLCSDDERLVNRFVEHFGLPPADVELIARDGAYLDRTAELMLAFTQCFRADQPSAVLIVGSGDAALAAALSGNQLGINVAHVGAGLRSFDRSDPAEMNRVLTDAASLWLFAADREAEANLRREAIPDQRIFLAGNTLVDALVGSRPTASRLQVARQLGLPDRYIVVTMNHAHNVGSERQLRSILYALVTLGEATDVVFPVHPRTAKGMSEFGLWDEFAGHRGLRLIPALPYLEFISLLQDSCAVLTDSGSVQDEALVIGIPCVTLRHHTERHATLSHGGNRLAGDDAHLAVQHLREALEQEREFAPVPEGWDGKASSRIVDVLEKELAPARPPALVAE